jgi:hypothetical protein
MLLGRSAISVEFLWHETQSNVAACGVDCDAFGMQEGIFEEFSKAVVEKVNKFKLGGGMDPNTTLGPLISQAAVDRVHSCTSLFALLFCVCWMICESVAIN